MPFAMQIYFARQNLMFPVFDAWFDRPALKLVSFLLECLKITKFFKRTKHFVLLTQCNIMSFQVLPLVHVVESEDDFRIDMKELKSMMRWSFLYSTLHDPALFYYFNMVQWNFAFRFLWAQAVNRASNLGCLNEMFCWFKSCGSEGYE